jgi:hypothetical protein
MQNIVAIEEKNTVLDYIYNLSQFLYNGKLITLIGELHEHRKAICDKNNVISVSDYCYKELSMNSNCQIILEYHSTEKNPETLQTITLKNTYKKCSCKFQGKIIAGDFRQDILTHTQQGDLYNNKVFWKFHSSWIHDNFIKPFYSKKDEYFSFLIKENYEDKVFNMLMNEKRRVIESMNTMSNELNHPLHSKYKHNIDPDQQEGTFRMGIKKGLMISYQRLSDMKILAIILSLKSIVSECIIIIGMAHFEYLYTYLKQISDVTLTESTTEKNKCVSLYRSYVWNENGKSSKIRSDLQEHPYKS